MEYQAVTGATSKAIEEPQLSPIQAIESTWLLAVLAILAITGYIIRRRRIRSIMLAATVVYIGFIKGGGISIAGLIKLLHLQISLTAENIFWYGLMAFAFLAAIFVGRIYCGWLCPFGAASELLSKLVPKKVLLSKRHDSAAKSVKYVLLLLAIVTALLLKNTEILKLEPFAHVFRLRGGGLALIFAGAVLAVSAVSPRFYCRYLCMVGAALALFSKVSLFRIRFKQGCTECGKCRGACPTGAIVAPKISVSECIKCNECRIACPEDIL